MKNKLEDATENIDNLKITDIEEYKYLQHLVLKYCRISNAAL